MTAKDHDDGTFRKDLRQKMIVCRTALSPERHAELSRQVRAGVMALLQSLEVGANNKLTPTLGFCWPVQNEPDLVPLMSELATRGRRIALPVVLRRGAPLAFREWWPDQPLAPDSYDIPTPTDGDFFDPDVLLLPVNAFDEDGYRIGYGGGFFDRTIAARSPRPLAIGLGFSFQRVPTTRPQPHDLPLDAIVIEDSCCTPKGSRLAQIAPFSG